MQNAVTTFSWGTVADRIITKQAADPVRKSLKDKFGLFADPTVFLLIRDDEVQDRVGRLCNQIGVPVTRCFDLNSLLQELSASSALSPTICVVDEMIDGLACKQIEKALEGHFISNVFQVVDASSIRDSDQSTDSVISKQLELPVDQDVFSSAFNEFMIMASQLAGHLRRIQKLEALNEREKILVQLISFGVPNKSSASILKLAEKTVEKCRTGVYRKLDVRSTGELASLVTMANFYRWPAGMKAPIKASV